MLEISVITDNVIPWSHQVRLGEKETLESTLKFFDDRIERLSELEFYQASALGIPAVLY